MSDNINLTRLATNNNAEVTTANPMPVRDTDRTAKLVTNDNVPVTSANPLPVVSTNRNVRITTSDDIAVSKTNPFPTTLIQNSNDVGETNPLSAKIIGDGSSRVFTRENPAFTQSRVEYEPVAVPTSPLVWEFMYKDPTVVPRSIGIDGNLYLSSLTNVIYMSEDGGTTLVAGASFAAETPSSVIYVTRTDTGYVVITRNTASGIAAIWHSATFGSGFTKVQELNGGHVELFNIFFYHGKRNDRIGLVGEYKQGAVPSPLGLYLTRNGGQTWTRILDTVRDDPLANSHFHHAIYDPYRGRIIAACGDGVDNGRVRYSDDMGATWKTVNTGTWADGFGQPTLMIPTYKRIILAPDSGSVPALVLALENDDSFTAVNTETYKLRTLYGVSDRTLAGEHYGEPPYAVNGDEIYATYWDKTKRSINIVGSGDNGATWHRVYSAHMGAGFSLGASGIVGVDKNGWLFSYSNDSGGAFLLRAKPPKWNKK